MNPHMQPWDIQMNEEISRLLRAHGEIDTTNIQLQVEEGKVFLLGSVPEVEMKTAAEDLVVRSPGVGAVSNFLEIKREETICP